MGRLRGRPRTALAAAAVLLASAATACGDAGSSRTAGVAERGARVMPFDLDATTHVFTPRDDGGVQRVVADDPRDGSQVERVRSHLRAEATRFAGGDFGDPAAIHGRDMPGLDVLSRRADALEVAYDDVAGGGEITYRSADPAVVAALHDWFAAQLADHGAHAEAG
jgi:hypothetical protein